MKDFKGSTGTTNCRAMKYEDIVKLDDLTEKAIDEKFLEKNKLNDGLWLRSRMLAKSRDRDIVTIAPLSLLHPLFAMQAWYPHRTNLGVTINMRNDSQILMLKEGSTEQVKLTVTDIYLSMKYGTYRNDLRTRWMKNISSLGLRRNLQVFKTHEFPIAKDATFARYPSIFSFGTAPQTLMIWVQPARIHGGNFTNNRYCFKNFGLDTLKVFLSGIPLKRNTLWQGMNLGKRYSYFHFYWYKRVIETFGQEAKDVSLDSFYDDTFVYCVSLAKNPRYGDDYGFTHDPSLRKVSFIEGSTIDVEMIFKEPMEEPMLVSFCGLFDIVVGMDADGIPLDEDIRAS